jgi:putative spermidine/putrescine transport system ATP-binding protein
MQFDRPEQLYRRPNSAFVARFVGFENILAMKVAAREAGAVVAETVGGATLRLAEADFGPIPDSFSLAARADGLVVTAGPDAGGLPARLGLRTYLGRAYQYQCEAAPGRLVAIGPAASPYEPGMAVGLVPNPEQCAILPAGSS